MSWDSIWDKIFAENEWGKYPSENLIQFIARNYYKSQRDKINILEIGCGPGANIWYLSREGFKAFGIDGSKIAISKAINRIKKEGLTAELEVGDVEKLPYDNNYFDTVIDNECLFANTYKSSEKINSEIKRVMKVGGFFL